MSPIEKLQSEGWEVVFPQTVPGERLTVRAIKGAADHGQFYEAGKLNDALAILAEKVANNPQPDSDRDPDPLRVEGDPVDAAPAAEPKAKGPKANGKVKP